MEALKNWFTPQKRDAIYTAVAAIAPILVTAGVILPGNVEPILALVAAGLQGFAGVLALLNLKKTDAFKWFGTVGRAVIYSGAVGVAGSVVALGLVTNEWADSALTYLSFGLTALASVLAVITPKTVELTPEEIERANEEQTSIVVDGTVVTPENVEVTVDETYPAEDELEEDFAENRDAVG